MFKGLSLDQAPPFEAPLLFFVSGIVFAIVASLFLLFGYDTIGTLHLFTLGFTAIVMMGALQQMLPVVVGVNFQKVKLFSIAVLIPFLIGILLFFISFTFGYNLFMPAALLLLFAIGFFAGVTLYKLFKAPFTSATVIAMRLSLLSLLIALLLGVHLLTSIALGKGVQEEFLLAHALFAGVGWIGLLIIGVAYQVIPMFYVTQEFNESIKKYLAPFLFTLLVTVAVSLFVNTTIAHYLFVLILFGYILFGVIALKELIKRKRAILEPSILFWYTGLGTLFILPILYFIDGQLVALLFLFGFATSIIYAMLYKIIPFLVWFHISSWGFFDMPTMKEMISEKLAYIHFGVFITALICLFFSLPLAGLMLFIANTLLLFNLIHPIKIYFTYKKKPSPFATKR